MLLSIFTPTGDFPKISSGGVDGLALSMPNGSGGRATPLGIGAGNYNHKTDEMTQHPLRKRIVGHPDAFLCAVRGVGKETLTSGGDGGERFNLFSCTQCARK